jgi:hypothetical protein
VVEGSVAWHVSGSAQYHCLYHVCGSAQCHCLCLMFVALHNYIIRCHVACCMCGALQFYCLLTCGEVYMWRVIILLSTKTWHTTIILYTIHVACYNTILLCYHTVAHHNAIVHFIWLGRNYAENVAVAFRMPSDYNLTTRDQSRGYTGFDIAQEQPDFH